MGYQENDGYLGIQRAFILLIFRVHSTFLQGFQGSLIKLKTETDEKDARNGSKCNKDS
jgi:hypothetical protein